MGEVPVSVLVVEDDARIRAAIRIALGEEGYEVLEADSGEAALAVVGTCPIDIALVDVMLPGMSGFDLCRSLRRNGELPIVMVTARDDTHDVVAGLEAGADDYVRKPFEPKELTARMRALLRRSRVSAEQSNGELRFGSLEILPTSGVVRSGGEPIALTKTEFLLLRELAEHAGVVLSREQLLDRVWGYDYLGDGRLVDAHVRRLRAKIEADPSQPQIVVTVRGFGYRLEKS